MTATLRPTVTNSSQRHRYRSFAFEAWLAAHAQQRKKHINQRKNL
jgi:hypothetical protein